MKLRQSISVDEEYSIDDIIKSRNIEHLIHFTNAKNINSIMANGIIPVKFHNKLGIKSCINDNLRNDELTETTSLSIEFPNYKMFYKLRIENLDEDWAIIFVNSKILLDKICLFCYDNASNPEIKSISYEKRMSKDMFNKMFEDIDGYHSRKETHLKRYFTTSPQAEVLVSGIVEVKYIDKIVFIDAKTKEKYRQLIPSYIKCEVIPEYFYAREDFIYEIRKD
ncbi:DarT ssDNA thymidine ADP-ribosyltransferase family protein [Paraclostridium bifermentans]|uniref:DarT ssDNA thymidine ADP-ribosyltransferase family protein n=1 Tax=Paraclostridium bifermentans TaxID=1490 RepID=UPI0018AB2DBB|nr:DarT ssDNA thymidine ADP-ribosyltransferase family protein [Paraclostridium bifermentans]